ncbi:hypothetical protein K1T71_012842 [Dendrolimus kikuchii]|uniref:Uncharacterized protein n=1 Tax=Dendrolimus kikuchii TaxID=765133 RepID=A0ACC1CIL3_9NEOP|nr:hypothetical protein K1T71_012842 [Dendrolimus kikuchii]
MKTKNPFSLIGLNELRWLLSGACSGKEMNQGGLKNTPAESNTRLDKRERRRGAAGRAAVLRRAPSDSDCSGETASLSADSGDRVVRPAPPPTRSGKSRSRRRGSEWEVLEGLKDGQRFEKRPDVFNGYLHKKRKWPLKGWHKRFFVVDGGILVYARSPTDVARGRLHGSVDVGLSVISAKARRRRIDIDADEFIYHLRAKTPEVFRTWLNVLKAHRLYRQHLLTFGARESVPKIHAPLDDLPPTDTSSRTSHSSLTISTLSSAEPDINSENIFKIESYGYDKSPKHVNNIPSFIETSSSIFKKGTNSVINSWGKDDTESELIPFNFESHDIEKYSHIFQIGSLCSMNCKKREYFERKQSPHISIGSSDIEKQIHTTELDIGSLRNNKLHQQSSALYECNLNSHVNKETEMKIVAKYSNIALDTVNINDSTRNSNISKKNQRLSLFEENKIVSPTACFFFSRRKNRSDNSPNGLRRSKKCTNVVKYRNAMNEPTLRKPLSKCMLLGKYKKQPLKYTDTDKTKYGGATIDLINSHKQNTEAQVEFTKKEKALQYSTTISDYDQITDRLMVSIFEGNKSFDKGDKVKYYITQVVKDLYDYKINQDIHPVKALFRNLLEYWLKNTSISHFKQAMTDAKAIDRPSNKYFTKDEKLSSMFFSNVSKATQFHGISELIPTKQKKPNKQISRTTKTNNKKAPPKCSSPRRDTESFEKERRIQELEKLLKNTVYVCETSRSKDKDIKMTKTLIDNLDKYSKKSVGNKLVDETSNSSSELPEIQETIDHLISDTEISPDLAKEFLGAYLDVLLHDSNKTITKTSSQSSGSCNNGLPKCEVQTESVIKKVCRSVTTLEIHDGKPKNTKVSSSKITKTVDPGQLYLKDILDKITTIFSKVKKFDEKMELRNKIKHTDEETEIKDELGRPVKDYRNKNLILKNFDENSLVIDLSKYNLEHISMLNDPAVKGMLSITIKLQEKSQNYGKSNCKHLSQYDDTPIAAEINKSKLLSLIHSNDTTSHLFNNLPNKITGRNLYLDYNAEDFFDMKPLLSCSDATSKAFKDVHESEHSLDLSFRSSQSIPNDSILSNIFENNDTQSCYIISTLKKGMLPTILQSKKKVKMKETSLKTDHYTSLKNKQPQSGNFAIFEKSAPKIIDEKFILLLLENLSLLSKGVPSLNKDISTLYAKLQKKHERTVKNCTNIEGLSLLGKIYKEETCNKSIDNTETQFTSKFTQSNQTKKIDRVTIATSTSFDSSILNMVDEDTSTVCFAKERIHTEVQTEFRKIEPNLDKLEIQTEDIALTTENNQKEVANNTQNKQYINNVNDIMKIPLVYICQNLDTNNTNLINEPINSSNNKTESTQTMSTDSFQHTEIITKVEATSNQSLFEHIYKKDCAMSTIIKYVLNLNDVKQFRLNKPTKIERDVLKKSKQCSKIVKQELIRELKLLSPSFKVSTPSQTDKKAVIHDKNKDFKVYQLFVSKEYNITKSSSMTMSKADNERSDDLKTIYRCNSDPSCCSGLISPTSPPIRGPQFVSGTPGGRLASWIIESGGPLENASRELGQAQLSVQQLQRLLDALEMQQQVHHDTDVSIEGASPNVKKDRRKFGLRKKKSNSKCASVELAPPHIDPSSSHMALSALTAPPSPGGGASSIPNSAASLPIAFLSTFMASTLVPCAAARPQSLPGTEALGTAAGPASLSSLTPDHQLREDFTILAKDLLGSLKSIVATLVCERGRLRAAMEAGDSASTPGGSVVAALRTNLTSALQQNSELRSRLSRIHLASDLAEISPVTNSDPVTRQFQQSLSYSSSCVSASEFFDAEEHEDDDLKPEQVIAADEAGAYLAQRISLCIQRGNAASLLGTMPSDSVLSAEQVTLRLSANGTESRNSCWTRRTRLPAPRPTPGGPSLWNLLYKNIGKDLSQISMPVTINEPLNMLQRLCEELEYSELLDSASDCNNPIERMALVAAFAVSSYAASAHRAASKPFNPLLGETYECIRDDRRFRFVAEQVSHHPPISACHAESPRWIFWQEARIKTKFWGKSMEFQPTGRVHVRLLATGDHYSWNKVTTCVHNLFGGQRWVDQYGDMHIMCHGTDINCKLNFIKASSWSSSRHEVRGAVTCGSTGARLRLAGRWSEALYAGDPPAARCLWRPGATPPEHEIYYGFTRFAMELNEMEPGMRDVLPHTDTRLRPDQRALEEGDVDSAEQLKHELEQSQRERRRDIPDHTPIWFRKILEDGEETWVFGGEYWKAREAGFGDHPAPAIW